MFPSFQAAELQYKNKSFELQNSEVSKIRTSKHMWSAHIPPKIQKKTHTYIFRIPTHVLVTWGFTRIHLSNLVYSKSQEYQGPHSRKIQHLLKMQVINRR